VRNYFRGTEAHNTVRINSSDQAVPGDPFSWSDIPTVTVEQWITGSTCSYFSASHNGYKRLSEPVIHRRAILSVGGGICFVRDVVMGGGRHAVDVHWHFAPRVQITSAENSFTATVDESYLHLVFAADGEWAHAAEPGKHSPVYGRIEPNPLVRSHAVLDGLAELGTVLMVDSAKLKAIRTATRLRGTVRCYEMETSASKHYFFFSMEKRMWNCGDWGSDAELLYCQTRGAELIQLFVIGGTSITYRSEVILSIDDPLEWLEWRKQEGSTSTTANRSPVPVVRTDYDFLQSVVAARS
jgi:Heparinase II/III-like protein